MWEDRQCNLIHDGSGIVNGDKELGRNDNFLQKNEARLKCASCMGCKCVQNDVL